jgi:uncharacterized protein
LPSTHLCFAETFWPLDHRHGKCVLEDAITIGAVAAARLGAGLVPADFQDGLYVDIEPTGLSGGRGRFAFLVGIGSFEALSFRLRQYFLADLAQETAMLESVAALFARKKLIVTFNGRTFDVPRLEARFALNRLPALMAGMPHVDLLVAVRRLYGRRLDSCRLGFLEHHLLGFDRYGDIAEFPSTSLYLDDVHPGGGLPLDPLFRHNAVDVLSLVTLVAHLGEMAGSNHPGDAAHLLAVAKWDEANGDQRRAMSLYECVWRRDGDGDAGREAIVRLTRIHRRAGDLDVARSLWLEEVETTSSDARRASALVELARLGERCRDYPAALDFMRQASDLLEALPRFRRPLHPTLVEIAQRSERLATLLALRRHASNPLSSAR